MKSIFGLHHVGFTVPDMEHAVQFFHDIFDAVTIMECGSVDVNYDSGIAHSDFNIGGQFPNSLSPIHVSIPRIMIHP